MLTDILSKIQQPNTSQLSAYVPQQSQVPTQPFVHPQSYISAPTAYASQQTPNLNQPAAAVNSAQMQSRPSLLPTPQAPISFHSPEEFSLDNILSDHSILDEFTTDEEAYSAFTSPRYPTALPPATDSLSHLVTSIVDPPVTSHSNDTHLSPLQVLTSVASSRLSTPVPSSADASASSATGLHIPPPFPTPPKLQPIDEVLGDNPGTSLQCLRNLTVNLAKKSIFGKEAMSRCSLSGRNRTASLSEHKVNYIKALIRGRVPEMSQIEFQYTWEKCRESLSKSCQTLRGKYKK